MSNQVGFFNLNKLNFTVDNISILIMTEIRAVPIKDFLSGSIAGIVSVVLGQPLETVKVRLQSQQNLYRSSIDCISKMYTNEGFLSFYKGTLSPLIGISFCFGISFSANSFSKSFLKKENINKGGTGQLSMKQYFYCGLFTGLCTSILNCPIEYIRIIMQVQGVKIENNCKTFRKDYTGSVDCFLKVYKAGGIKGLYAGMTATALRDVPGGGIYFGLLENLMKKGEKIYGCKSKMPCYLIMCCGSLAGIISALIIFPMDVVKSIIQANSGRDEKYKKVITTIRAVIIEKGYVGFLNGLTPCMVRSLPISAIAYLTFEKSSNYFRHRL
jgi:solute carrier family 25 carnitine/acylcarnitine transporter 20/29